MEFKLKYSSGFSFVNGIQTFIVGNNNKRGVIEVETINNDSSFEILSYQFLITRNEIPLYPQPPSTNPKLDLDYENKTGNWSLVAIVSVKEQGDTKSEIQEYRIPGNWKVINEASDVSGAGSNCEQSFK